MKRVLLIINVLLFSFCISRAQDDKSAINGLITQDSADVYKLATYPDSVRHDIYEVSTQPPALADLQDAEKETSDQFKSLLVNFSMDNQKEIYGMQRYKGLVSDLVAGGRKSKKAYEEVMQIYPQNIRNGAVRLAIHHFRLLKKLNKLNEAFQDKFNNIIQDYSIATQNAFRNLLNRPEILSLLSSNMNVTVRLGNIYQQNPKELIAAFNSLHAELAAQKKRDIAQWKQQIQSDTAMQQQLEQSAREYANDEEEGPDYFAAPDNPDDMDDYSTAPYPYWCGYPWWYDYENWYPYPGWYDCGFYYGAGGITWCGVPSWGFMHWFFWHSNNFDRYPNLANAYINFYHRQHRASAYGGVVVRQWLRENKSFLPKDFVQNRNDRVQALKEFGQFSRSYAVQKAANPGNSLSASEYMNQHAGEYPHLQHPVTQPRPAAGNGNGSSFNERGNSGRSQATPMRSPSNAMGPHQITEPRQREEWINDRPQYQPSYHSMPHFSSGSFGGGFHGGGGFRGAGGFHGSGGRGRH